MLIDKKLLDEVTERAKASERLRMNYNLHDSVCLQTNVYQYGLSVLFYKHSEIVSYFCFLSPHYFVRGRLKTKIFSQ